MIRYWRWAKGIVDEAIAKRSESDGFCGELCELLVEQPCPTAEKKEATYSVSQIPLNYYIGRTRVPTYANHEKRDDLFAGRITMTAPTPAQLAGHITPATFDPSKSPAATERLGFFPSERIGLSAIFTFICGFGLGNAHGGRVAALRFRAQNSHRLPTSQRGWYFYHKAKHTYVVLASMKEGARFGVRLVPWSVLFFGVEQVVDARRARDDRYNKDFFSTTIAGLTVAGAFSAWNKMPLPTAARMAKIGLLGGLSLGLTQDLLHLLKGNPPSYVSNVKRLLGVGENQETRATRA